jgi:hypothetical protein
VTEVPCAAIARCAAAWSRQLGRAQWHLVRPVPQL